MDMRTGQGRNHALLLALLLAPAASAQEIVRHPAADDTDLAPSAVEVPAAATVVHLIAAPPAPSAARTSDVTTGYGSTQVQTVAALGALDAGLGALGLTMDDVFRLRVFLVPPAGTERMDLDGFLAGHAQVFGPADGPDLPLRTVIEVAGLSHPEWLVEIEASALRPAAPE
jgi:enamine deaminase RidA (YjgF/YER057c/UK114 family)